MAYEKFYPGGWQSGEAGGTPITPESLDHIEQGIKDLDAPAYTAASALAALVSGEYLSVALGKLAKAVADLISHLANKSNPHGVSLTQLGIAASATELNYVKGVTSAIQSQLNGKAASGHTHTPASIGAAAESHTQSYRPLSDKGMTLLWENASPTSEFAAQTVTLNSDLSNYDAVLLLYRITTSKTWVMPLFLITDEPGYCAVHITYNATRRVTANNGNQLTCYDASVAKTYGSPATDNSYCIPYKIYGVKWVH